MKKGILFYTETDANLNKWFISHITEEAKELGADIELCIYDGTPKPFADADFCINRTRFSYISEDFEQKGIRSFNNSRTIKTANDKWLTFKLCQKLGIPVMETKIADDFENVKFPFVLKSRNGHGGSEVLLIENDEQLKNAEFNNQSGYIMQNVCSDRGIDVRVYTLGGKAVATVKRTSENDFRSNFSLGGKVELFTPEKEQLLMIEKLQSELNTDYAGFDFIMHNGKWVLNEIEDAVGARMLYSLCDSDIIRDYAKYIAERIDDNA